MGNAKSTVIGVISDTHGLLRPQAVQMLDGSDAIIHAGDIGKPEVLDALGAIAPVTAVRGNVDRGAWAQSLPEREWLQIAGYHFYVLHDLNELDIEPGAAGVDAVISGHSHRPKISWRDHVLYMNPGSAGPQRFRLPVALGKIELGAGLPNAQWYALET